MKRKKILLTGASGFIGKNIIDILQKKNFIIYCFVRKQKKNTKKIKYIKHDLLNYIKFDKTCDVIIHCSAKSPEKDKFNYTDYRNNISITKNLIEYSKKNKPEKIIYLSSLSIYGRVVTKKVNEKTRILNSDLYGKSKYECENLFKKISKKIPVISIRLPGVIGKNSVRNWLSNLIDDVKANRSINVYNLDGFFNNTIHVNDLGKFRLETLRNSNDGFYVAEKDLELRGPGEVLGIRQSGEENFRLSSLKDIKLRINAFLNKITFN